MPKSVPYSGNNAYKHIDRLLKKERRLFIATPFISIGYAKLLKRLSARKRIYLVTTKRHKENAAAIRYLKKGNLSKKALALLLLAIAVASGFYSIYIACALGFCAAFAYYSAHGSVKVRFLEKKPLHEKLYIGKNRAIVGSANLTFSGTRRNIEHLEIITDRNEIRKISKHFYELWKSSEE